MIDVLNPDYFQLLFNFFNSFFTLENEIKTLLTEAFQKIFKSFTSNLEERWDTIDQRNSFNWRNALKANIFFVEWMVENYLNQNRSKKKEIKKAVKVSKNLQIQFIITILL